MSDPHTGFIVAAYVLALAVVLGTILVVILDHRALRRTLQKLEKRFGTGQK
jgi:heme exporter protein CcmD